MSGLKSLLIVGLSDSIEVSKGCERIGWISARFVENNLGECILSVTCHRQVQVSKINFLALGNFSMVLKQFFPLCQ